MKSSEYWLVLPPALLEKYLTAAEAILDHHGKCIHGSVSH